MNCLLWYNKRDPALSVWTSDTDAASILAESLTAQGFNVVWTVHTTDTVRAQHGHEKALAAWRLDRC